MQEPEGAGERPLLIAVAGPSCSGKSTLARRLAADLGGVVLPVDAYYKDLSHLPPEERAQVNFDSPEAIDREALAEAVRRLAGGQPIERPVYDFRTHTRTDRRERVPAAPVIVLEGLFALCWEEIRELCHLRVFVELEDRLCLERRLRRDTAERGRTAESVIRQYEESVRPMAERHVLPTRRFADVIVDGRGALGSVVEWVRAAGNKQTEPSRRGPSWRTSSGAPVRRR